MCNYYCSLFYCGVDQAKKQLSKLVMHISLKHKPAAGEVFGECFCCGVQPGSVSVCLI